MSIRSSVVVLTALAASAATVAVADIVDFPNTDGSGDLSSAAAWGGTLPATTDTIELNKNYGKTLTFSSSCTFDSLLFKGNNTANTIEITDPSVTVTLLGAVNTEPGIRSVVQTTSASLTLKGGTYDLNSTGKLTASASTVNNNSNSGCTLTLDGVTVKNAANVAVANARDAGNCRLVMTNGTHVSAHTADRFMNSYSVPRAPTGIVSGGSSLTLTGGSFNPFYNYIFGGLVLVTGEGSVISNASTSSDNIFYTNPKQCVIRVEKGGEIDFRSPSVCYSGGVSNVLEVASGGIIRFFGGNVSFPYSKDTPGTTLKVLEDGTFSTANSLTLQQADNLILVSNGTFQAALEISGTRNTVQVSGPKAAYEQRLSRIFSGNSKYCLLEFSDGATWSYYYPYLTSSGAVSNTLSVVRNATVTFGQFNGISYNANAVIGYTVRVADGGKIECKAPAGHSDWNSYIMAGWDNATVVSNGTLDVEKDLRLGITNVAAEVGMTDTRNSLVLQGRTPFVKIGQDANLSRGTHLRFEVPSEGYPDKAVLFEAKQIYRGDGEAIRLEIAGLDAEYAKQLPARFDAVLVKSTGNTVNNVRAALGDQIAALAPTMPDRVRLYISADGTELHLSAKPVRGMVLLVR